MWVHVDRYAVRSCEGVIERIFRGCSWGTARVKRERISYVSMLSRLLWVYVCTCVCVCTYMYVLRVCVRLGQFFRGFSACVGPRGCGGFRLRTVRLIDSGKRPAIMQRALKIGIISIDSIFHAVHVTEVRFTSGFHCHR